MSSTVAVSHLRKLLGSPAEEPVLYLQRDEDTGAPTALEVWAEAYVSHDDENLLDALPEFQAMLDEIPAEHRGS